MKSSHLSIAVALLVSLGSIASAGEFPDEWFFPMNPAQKEKLNAVVGKPMPELKLADWMVKELKPEDYKGKVLVIDVWATWCGPCIASIPKNNAFYKEYSGKGVEFIGVCSSRGQDKMQEVAEKHAIAYPIAKDPGNATAQAFGVQFFPTYIVVDEKGIVRAIGIRPDSVSKVVDKVLAGRKG